MRLLVVEDEGGIAGALRQGLGESGYAVDLTRDGDDLGQAFGPAGDGDVALVPGRACPFS